MLAKKPETLGNQHELGERPGAELLHKIVPMRLDRALGGPELVRDLLVEIASRDALEHLSLPRGQSAHEPAQRLEPVVLLLARTAARERPLDCGEQRFFRDRLGEKVFRARL